jgi:amino acid adenylation domain-containing protein
VDVLVKFSDVARRNPQATALCLGEASLSYGDLDRRSNQLARRLRSLGVRSEVRVALCLERSFEWVIAIWAVWKAGGAFVPVDPSYPDEFIAFMLDDAAPALVLDAGWTASHPFDNESDGPLQGSLDPGQLAYLIYTSGSTGRPKGVLVEHRGLVNLATEQIRAFAVTPSSRVLQFASPSFDASISEVLMALLAGAALHLSPRSTRLTGASLVALLRTQRITTVTLPPSLLALLPPNDIPALETVAAAGEICSAEVVARWAPGRRFLNAYGPTETTVCATMGECHPSTGMPSIGRPIANTEVHVLDEQGKPARVGELFVGGIGLARGYHRRPELTAERFVVNPFGPGRLYRTGDLVNLREDGALDFLGRIDHQIKLRGYRIEPGEIESALRAHPSVRDAMVIMRSDGFERLVAYVVGDALPSETQLRAHLAGRLPEHMIPAAFVSLPAFPLSPNGKVDRSALPRPTTARPALDHPEVPPRDPLELALSELWRETLGLDSVGVTDEFVALGGTSLVAMRTVAGLQLRYRHPFSAATLLEGSTIEQLAEVIRSGGGADHPALVHLRRNGDGRPLFLVHPVNGNVLCYVELTRLLGPGRPVYGIQVEELDGRGTPISDLRVMAARYVEVMRAVQPEGPYLLGGWSAGGIIGFEMARQLRSAGHDIAALVLIDARQPTSYGAERVKELTDDYSASKMAFWFVLTFGRCMDVEIAATHEDFMRRRGADLDDYVAQQLRALVPLPPRFGPTDVRPMLDVYRATLRAIVEYKPEPYAGPLVLLRSTNDVVERPFAPHPPPWRWDGLATSVETRDLSGNHFNLLYPPHVERLAAALRDVLNRADPPRG